MDITGKELKAIATIAALKRDGRERLEVVWLDSNPDGKARLWATDGHHLIVKEFEIGGPELPHAYRVSDIKRLLATDEVAIYEPNKGYMHHPNLPNGFATAEELEPPPDVDHIIPTISDTPRLACNLFGVNPLLLAKGLKVVATLARSKGVRFQLDDGALGPICITSDLETIKYIIMPFRVGGEMTVTEIMEKAKEDEPAKLSSVA